MQPAFNMDRLNLRLSDDNLKKRMKAGKSKGWDIFNPWLDTQYLIRVLPAHPKKNPDGFGTLMYHRLHPDMSDIRDQWGGVLKSATCLTKYGMPCPFCQFLDAVTTNEQLHQYEDFMADVALIQLNMQYAVNIYLLQTEEIPGTTYVNKDGEIIPLKMHKPGKLYYWSFSPATMSPKKGEGIAQFAERCPNFTDPEIGRDIVLKRTSTGMSLIMWHEPTVLPDLSAVDKQYDISSMGDKKKLSPQRMWEKLREVPSFAQVIPDDWQ